MPKISEEKRKKIKENILALLFEKMPKPLFTSNIAKELARDEEFIKAIMLELEKEALVKRVNAGKQFLRKIRWTLSDNAYVAYKNLLKEQIKEEIQKEKIQEEAKNANQTEKAI